MPRTSHSLELILFSLFLLAVSSNCNAPEERTIEQEIAVLVKTTVPGNATMIGGPDMQRNSNGVSAFWEFRSERSWKQYLDWVKAELDTTYTLIAVDEEKAHFWRSLPGDSYLLQLRNSSDNTLHVRVDFTARPF